MEWKTSLHRVCLLTINNYFYTIYTRIIFYIDIFEIYITSYGDFLIVDLYIMICCLLYSRCVHIVPLWARASACDKVLRQCVIFSCIITLLPVFARVHWDNYQAVCLLVMLCVLFLVVVVRGWCCCWLFCNHCNYFVHWIIYSIYL